GAGRVPVKAGRAGAAGGERGQCDGAGEHGQAPRGPRRSPALNGEKIAAVALDDGDMMVLHCALLRGSPPMWLKISPRRAGRSGSLLGRDPTSVHVVPGDGMGALRWGAPRRRTARANVVVK